MTTRPDGSTADSRRPTVTEALARCEPADRENARAALDWLLPEGGSWEDLSQLAVQKFLWYSLPMKWLVEPDEHHVVAAALGRVLADAGLTRLAALCQSAATHRLIDLWDADQSAARRELRRLLDTSGVEPPRTQRLEWGRFQGMDENRASWVVSTELERAIDSGRLVPGARGWRSVAVAVTDETLLGPGPDGSGASLLLSVLHERRASWLRDAARDGVVVPAPLVAALTGPPGDDATTTGRPSEEEVASLEPLRWLLEQVGPGAALTQAGLLPTALVRAADERFHWSSDGPLRRIRGESDLPELATLHELAREQRLLAVRKGRIAVTATGRAALANPPTRLDAVYARLLTPGTWRGDAGTAVGLALLGDAPVGPAMSTDELYAAVAAFVARRWRVAGGEPTASAITSVTWEVLRVASLFGWTVREADAWFAAPRLTPVGRAAVTRGLVRAAEAPRTRP